MAFLSLLDERARPKGSRDPLGFELVWTHFGRRVVGNLTTITSSLEGFSVALLGFHWANELNINVSAEHKQKSVRETFIRYEQVAAYLRFYSKSDSIMGITRVTERARLENTSKILNIGMGTDEQILSDQASYGLWGLYSAAMRDTGLIHGSERVLTDKGREIALRIEKLLDKKKYIKLIQSQSILKDDVEKLSDNYMRAIQSEEVVDKLLESLMMGAEDNIVQHELWNKTNELFQLKKFTTDNLASIGDYIKLLESTDLSSQLSNRLHDIECIERVLVSLNNIFHYCRGLKDGISLGDMVDNLNKKQYNYSFLPESLPSTDFPRRQYVNKAFISLKEGDYKETIIQLLELNNIVMKQRNGAAWVELEGNRKLRIRMKSETSKLISKEHIETNWDYDYFLGSYVSMALSYLGNSNG